jgi:hypothetical protein
MGIGHSSMTIKCTGRKLFTQFHLMMGGAIPPLSDMPLWRTSGQDYFAFVCIHTYTNTLTLSFSLSLFVSIFIQARQYACQVMILKDRNM